ncbi:flavin-containing monooxygenase [Solimonas sp. K1W22B-7]|uniref:flavin-containing monooxygenase n=1 Tax=Solimonas sp. K1W22B-7 TaxID=2303331 RepID=UPI0013C44CB4|nr:NAD(P)/FAD-dependent oxidoreductase [Solimonas sp. K1W22B-7]
MKHRRSPIAASGPAPRVIIIGAGMSGILMGIKLRAAGIESFEILEMGHKLGGTWRDNTYPGLCCDVPAHTYAYTFEPNWKWKGLYAEGAEIQAYFEHCADKYGITPFVRLDTRVTGVIRENGAWTVTTADGRRRLADVVVTCVGGLVHPKTPEIPGLDSFAGATFHSARWDHSVPLEGRRVGVIGTGSTAVQITSALAGKAGHFSLFQRTPQWVCRNFEMRRPEWLRQLYRRMPSLAWATGRFQNLLLENTFSRGVAGNQTLMRPIEALCRANLDRVRDPVLKASLTPDYRVGCKRLVFSDSFYEAIQRPATELVTSPIERIEPRGIVTRDGRLHPLDVLVAATGFHVMDYFRGMSVIGDEGQNIGETWAQTGAQAHRTVAVAGCTNFFMVIGPNSPVGNFSLTGVSETQVRYIMQCIALLRDAKARALVPRAEAQLRHNERLRRGMKGTVWTSGCRSWYLDASGLPNVYPFVPQQFRRDMKRVEPEEFLVTPST